MFGEQSGGNRSKRRSDKMYSALTACRKMEEEQEDIAALINGEADYSISVQN
jgi:hypothetical protein